MSMFVWVGVGLQVVLIDVSVKSGDIVGLVIRRLLV